MVLLAVDWIETICQSEGSVATLLTEFDSNLEEVPALKDFAKKHHWVTLDEDRTHTSKPPTTGPVLAYQPTMRVLGLAIEIVESAATSLCAIEGPAFPLRGWASEAGALNLLQEDDDAASGYMHRSEAS